MSLGYIFEFKRLRENLYRTLPDAYRTPTGRLPDAYRKVDGNVGRPYRRQKWKKKTLAIASGNLAKPGRKKNGAWLARRASRKFFFTFFLFFAIFLLTTCKILKLFENLQLFFARCKWSENADLEKYASHDFSDLTDPD